MRPASRHFLAEELSVFFPYYLDVSYMQFDVEA